MEEKNKEPQDEWITRYLFVPHKVYYDWINPIMEEERFIKNDGLVIEFYNEDKDGINCRIDGYVNNVNAFFNSLLAFYVIEEMAPKID